MHQKNGCRPLLNVTVFFMDESMNEVKFSPKDDKNLSRMVKYLAPSRPAEKLGRE